jgi:hypothetical protein
MEGYEPEKVSEVLKLPLSYATVALLALGWGRGSDKFSGGRFSFTHTVFSEEYGRPLIGDKPGDKADE